MTSIDLFANQLLEEAKRFLEKSRNSTDPTAKAANLHAALMLSFCSLEAHVNSIAEEFSNGTFLSVHEKGLLLERDVRLEDGEFRVKEKLKMTRLEDRIQFLHTKFSSKPLDTSAPWWGRLGVASQLRNHLTHAKTIPTITESSVTAAVEAILQTLDALYKAIYKKPFPLAAMGLQTTLDF